MPSMTMPMSMMMMMCIARLNWMDDAKGVDAI
jgi:hypothetical protein